MGPKVCALFLMQAQLEDFFQAIDLAFGCEQVSLPLVAPHLVAAPAVFKNLLIGFKPLTGSSSQ